MGERYLIYPGPRCCSDCCAAINRADSTEGLLSFLTSAARIVRQARTSPFLSPLSVDFISLRAPYSHIAMVGARLVF